MTEQEVRRYLRKMSEQDSQSAFREFYDMTYDRLFRIAYYYTHHEEWSQEIVLDVFMKLWEHRKQLLDITNIEDYCFILVKNASLNYIEKRNAALPYQLKFYKNQQTRMYLPKILLSAKNCLPVT